MRSRDGDHSFLFTVSLILFSTLLSAEEYIISYRAVVKNSMLYSEKLSVTKTMKPCKGKPEHSFTIFDNNTKNLNTFLHKNINDFVENITPFYLELHASQTTTNMINKNLTTLELEPTCFEVEINDNFVTLTRLK